jgi:hypothetical protein
MYAIREGQRTVDLLVIPVLLIGPPLALLAFGLGAGWAFRGFRSSRRRPNCPPSVHPVWRHGLARSPPEAPACARYHEAADGAILVPDARGTDTVAHLCVVRCTDRDALRHHLANDEIASDIHYPVPDHRQVALRACSLWIFHCP